MITRKARMACFGNGPFFSEGKKITPKIKMARIKTIDLLISKETKMLIQTSRSSLAVL